MNLVYFDDEFWIICGFGDLLSCYKVYYKYNSFYKYDCRKYDDVYKGYMFLLEYGNYLIVLYD